MALTKVSTNYGGEVDGYLYAVMNDGLDFLQPDKAVYQKTGVRFKVQLDRLEHTANPIEAYTNNAPTFASVQTKKKRDLIPEKMTISGTFTPEEWLNDWQQYAPNGSLTQLKQNPAFLRRVMDLAINAGGTQLDTLFWQGDKAGAAALAFMDGIVTKLIADTDTDVNFVTPAGVITEANVVDRFSDMYRATPARLLKDPKFVFATSEEDYKKLELANLDVKKTTVGVLDEQVRTLFLNKKIVAYAGIPENHIIGAKISAGEDSNLVFGCYFSFDSEFAGVEVDKVDNLGKIYGWRVDFMGDAQYRYGGDIYFYKPV